MRLRTLFSLRAPQGHKLIKHFFCTINQNEFKTVYKFPYVRGIGIINRLKLYQTTVTAIAMPSAVILNQFGSVTVEDVMLTGIASLTLLIPLYGFGYFAHKLVGIVYLNENNNLVKFSYLNFWGKRKDVIVPIKEIVPFSESSSSVLDALYLKVRQFSSKETMKLCVKYGIVDNDGFNKIFVN